MNHACFSMYINMFKRIYLDTGNLLLKGELATCVCGTPYLFYVQEQPAVNSFIQIPFELHSGGLHLWVLVWQVDACCVRGPLDPTKSLSKTKGPIFRERFRSKLHVRKVLRHQFCCPWFNLLVQELSAQLIVGRGHLLLLCTQLLIVLLAHFFRGADLGFIMTWNIECSTSAFEKKKLPCHESQCWDP